MNKTSNTKIVKEYLLKYSEMPSLTLAKMIYKEYSHIFNSLDSIRTTIRKFRGASGKNSYKIEDRIPREFTPFLPTEDSQDYKPYQLLGVRKIGIISDIHIPNHRNRELNVALQKFDELDVDCIIINGDLLDNTPYTKFLTPPDKKDARRYLKLAEDFLQMLRDMFPHCRIIWAEGNHDFWYTQYLMRKAPELYGDPYYTLPARLKLEGKNIEYIEQTRYIKAGKLNICHGHYLVRGVFTPVSAARSVMLKAKVPTIIGHVHKTSEFTQTDLHGDICTTWSTGCLCTLTPDYMPMGGDANYGFASVTMEDNGHFHVSNYRIHNGKII